ncbi:MAG: T9SS type A sorting domain-containing protein [Bacteroidales bacterium]|nr:T9SS type A sorting domain-containing protein [Bacteroidales bacterium]
MKKITLVILLILAITNLFSQTSSIKVLQYNLLYYGLDDVGCDQSNNNIGEKTEYLKTLIEYIEPDIFAVNEIDASTNDHDYLLYNVFTLNGYVNYARGTVKGSYLTSQIFYNKSKLVLVEENEIYGNPRNIYEYVFYYKSTDLEYGDTVYFSYFLAHLKAGQDYEDERATTINNMMNYINSNNLSNYIFSGDLNLYGASEQAYQYLTNNSNSSINFTDPGPAGEWSINETYADYHTQATFYSSNGCSSYGGLDDRFDFILYSAAINSGTSKMQYNNNSFTTIGQDGNHFNSSIGWNGNTSIPSYILEVLENNSDHLPILAEFTFDQAPAKAEEIRATENYLTTNNPIKENINIQILNNEILNTKIFGEIFDLTGKLIRSFSIETNNRSFEYTVAISEIPSGIYIIIFSNKENFICSKKIIKL